MTREEIQRTIDMLDRLERFPGTMTPQQIKDTARDALTLLRAVTANSDHEVFEGYEPSDEWHQVRDFFDGLERIMSE